MIVAGGACESVLFLGSRTLHVDICSLYHLLRILPTHRALIWGEQTGLILAISRACRGSVGCGRACFDHGGKLLGILIGHLEAVSGACLTHQVQRIIAAFVLLLR